MKENETHSEAQSEAGVANARKKIQKNGREHETTRRSGQRGTGIQREKFQQTDARHKQKGKMAQAAIGRPQQHRTKRRCSSPQKGAPTAAENLGLWASRILQRSRVSCLSENRGLSPYLLLVCRLQALRPATKLNYTREQH